MKCKPKPFIDKTESFTEIDRNIKKELYKFVVLKMQKQ